MRARTALLILAVLGLAAMWIVPPGRTPRRPPEREPPAALYGPDGRYSGPPRQGVAPPNLIVLVIDTLRADCVAPPGATGGDMPFLQRLGRDGATFTHVTSPAVWTFPSLASLFTGLLPMEHGIWQSQHKLLLPRSVVTFAEALGAGHGYDTAALTAVMLPGGPLSMLQGFQHRRDRLTLRGVREALVPWAGGRDPARPFFLFLHTYEAHAPYGLHNHPWPEPPPQALPRASGPDPATLSDAELLAAYDLDYDQRRLLGAHHGNAVLRRIVRYRGRGWSEQPDHDLARRLEGAYRKGVREVDAELERTVTTLRELGLLENTLLVITSDHGEAFGEHGVLGHGQTVHDELARIPLVAVGPAPFQGGRTIATSMALHDLLPTFLDLAGFPALSGIEGRSMRGAIEDEAPGRATLTFELFEQDSYGRHAGALLVAARTASEKYVITYDVPSGTIVEELYDLVRDPDAQDDLLGASGRLGAQPVSAELSQAIESARDHVWQSATTSTLYAQMGYGAGVHTLEAERPAPAVVRTPAR